ncbi:MAG TPA: DNA polymerase III subunit beta [Terriglobia bacterium]|nr:DNA polymerase III subunit beta [Terriglobia bacterium]
MEISTSKNDLLKELNLTQGVVERKTTIPILSNLLFEVEESTLRISATDLDLGIRCGCPAKVKEGGSGAIPAKRLLEIVRSLPDAEVRFKFLENHYVQVNCERSSFKLVGMARDNFPVLPDFPKALAALPANVCAGMIQKTIFAISNEESRYTLNGALLLLKPETASMVATDGHRLAIVERDVQVQGLKNELRLLVPKKAMAELTRLLAEVDDETVVEISKDESHLFFQVGTRVLISRMLTGQFPNYEAVLPRDNTKIVEIDKELAAAAIRRVALLADERSHAIRMQVEKDHVEVFSSSGEYGEAHESLDAVYDKDPMQIGFNFQYLLDFMSVVGEGGKIRLELKDEQSAGQLRPGEQDAYRYRYVVMPMRI